MYFSQVQYSANFLYIHRILAFQPAKVALGQYVKRLNCPAVFRHPIYLSAPTMLGSTSLCPSPDSKEDAKGRWGGMGRWGAAMWPQPQARGCPHADRSKSALCVLAIFLIGLSCHLSHRIWVNLKRNSTSSLAAKGWAFYQPLAPPSHRFYSGSVMAGRMRAGAVVTGRPVRV